MGFIVPQGRQALTSSIGLTERMSLFRKQALRPYKTALTIMGFVFVLAVAGLAASNYSLGEKNDMIAQKTEDLVGPYELHDFYLYYVLRFGYEPEKIYRLAKIAFDGEYDNETMKKWLRTFYWRLFSQQIKRYCLQDGQKVGAVALSPRGDFRMPSDACATVWLNDVEKLS